MPCPCGSIECVCQDGCLCSQNHCQCSKCDLLPKVCSRCNLPYYIIVLKSEYERRVCSCKAQGLVHFRSGAHSNLQAQESATSSGSAKAPVRRNQCPRCSLPIIIVTKDEDFEHAIGSCCCSHKNSDSNTTVTPTEHETSNCSSDLREISADRQTRKALSRRTRTEKSNWQSKKAKEKEHSSNSPDSSNSAEEDSDTEVVASDECSVHGLSNCPDEDIAERNVTCTDPDSSNLAEEDSDTETVASDECSVHGVGNCPDEDIAERNATCTGSITSDSNLQNLNFDSSNQSPTGLFPRTRDNSTGNVSLIVNTSGISSPSTSKDFSNPPEGLGFLQLSHRVRPKLPLPFVILPKPISGIPDFGGYGGRCSPLQFKKTSRPIHPFLINQPEIARVEKMEKWFDTLENAMNTSGELPDAETAAALDREEKERLEQQPDDQSKDQSERQDAEKQAEPFESPNTETMPYSTSASAHVEKSGKEQPDVIDPTTDTERSSTLSKSRKESESD